MHAVIDLSEREVTGVAFTYGEVPVNHAKSLLGLLGYSHVQVVTFDDVSMGSPGIAELSSPDMEDDEKVSIAVATRQRIAAQIRGEYGLVDASTHHVHYLGQKAAAGGSTTLYEQYRNMLVSVANGGNFSRNGKKVIMPFYWDYEPFVSSGLRFDFSTEEAMTAESGFREVLAAWNLAEWQPARAVLDHGLAGLHAAEVSFQYPVKALLTFITKYDGILGAKKPNGDRLVESTEQVLRPFHPDISPEKMARIKQITDFFNRHSTSLVSDSEGYFDFDMGGDRVYDAARAAALSEVYNTL